MRRSPPARPGAQPAPPAIPCDPLVKELCDQVGRIYRALVNRPLIESAGLTAAMSKELAILAETRRVSSDKSSGLAVSANH